MTHSVDMLDVVWGVEMQVWRLVYFSVLFSYAASGEPLAQSLHLGETRRSARVYTNPETCEALAKKLNQPGRLPDAGLFPAATRYLGSLLRHLIARNPATFSGGTNPMSPCVLVAEFDDYEGQLYAESYLQDRLVQYSPSLLLAAANDAEVAAILSHEISHLTLQHQETELGNEKSPWWSRSLEKNELRHEELRLIVEEQGLERRIRAEKKLKPVDDAKILSLKRRKWKAYDRRVAIIGLRSDLDEEIHALEAKVYPTEFVTRWREQEADQSGLELYLRAGLPSASFYWFFTRNALYEDLKLIPLAVRDLLDPADYLRATKEFSAQKVVDLCKQGATRPAYAKDGVESYPTYCWRTWYVLEGLANYRAALEAPPGPLPRFEPSLDAAKEEIRKFRRQH